MNVEDTFGTGHGSGSSQLVESVVPSRNMQGVSLLQLHSY